MRTEREILDGIEKLEDKAQAILDVAKDEKRDLNEAEQAEFDGIMDEEKGTLAAEHKALEQWRKRDAAESRLALSRKSAASSSQPFAAVIEGNGNTAQPEVIHNRIGKLRAFKDEQTAYDCGVWFRSLFARINGRPDEAGEARCSRQGWDVRATATEGSPTAGGYLVPAPLSNAIIDVRDTAGVSRQLARVVPMTSDALDVPKKTAGTTVYYPGEAGAITASDQTWGNISLNAKKRAILSYVSQELADDAIVSIVDDLAGQMGLDLAIKEDSEWIKGDGTSTYGGVSGLITEIGTAAVSTAVTGEDTWAELDVDDFTGAMGLLPSKYWGRGVHWLCSSQFYYTTMLNVAAQAGGNTIQSLQTGDGMPQFLGVPVVFSSQCPTATAASTIGCYFGSFSDSTMIGDRGGVRIAQSDQYAFNTDRLAIRATTRYDVNVHDAGDSSNVGAITAVKTAA